MINLVTVVPGHMTLKDCAQIWHIANKFQNHKIKYWISFQHDPNQHHLTSLLFKLDWEKECNQNLEFEILFPKQVYNATNSTFDVKSALIEEYLKTKLDIDYVVYIDVDVIFSQQKTDSMWYNIRKKNNWYGGGSLIYGKNFKAPDQDWIFLNEYPLIEDVNQLQKNGAECYPPIGIFTKETKKSNQYISWKNFIEDKYLNGVNLFNWEKE